MPTKFYAHSKTQGFYFTVGTALHTETNKRLVLYKKCGQDEVYARPLEMFNGTISFNGTLRRRFEPIYPKFYKSNRSGIKGFLLNTEDHFVHLCIWPANEIVLIEERDFRKNFSEEPYEHCG